ncbi:hypothetical protein D1872_278680 [compost metagenome]
MYDAPRILFLYIHLAASVQRERADIFETAGGQSGILAIDENSGIPFIGRHVNIAAFQIQVDLIIFKRIAEGNGLLRFERRILANVFGRHVMGARHQGAEFFTEILLVGSCDYLAVDRNFGSLVGRVDIGINRRHD